MTNNIESLMYDNFIFTEGGSPIGLGHITRCLALYDELERRQLNPIFIINGEKSIEGILDYRHYKIDNWYMNWSKYLLGENSLKKNCIIDSYIADEKTYQDIQKFSKKALFIDDTNRIPYPEGIIVNPSIYGSEVLYEKKIGQLYLTGIEYVILRKEFQRGHIRCVKESISDILVILGGSDIRNLTPAVIRALSKTKFNGLNKHIVIGIGFTNTLEIENASKECPNINLYYNLNADHLYSLMELCDFAITAAGQTLYELIAMQLPFACIKIIDNQSNNVKGLIKERIINDYLDYNARKSIEVEKFLDVILTQYNSRIARENQIAEMKKREIGKGARLIIDALVG
jgi:UDP-2,4-diacetamido-2,4,6-trideoxy-beta-L-altropyranose hydrolase